MQYLRCKREAGRSPKAMALSPIAQLKKQNPGRPKKEKASLFKKANDMKVHVSKSIHHNPQNHKHLCHTYLWCQPVVELVG